MTVICKRNLKYIDNDYYRVLKNCSEVNPTKFSLLNDGYIYVNVLTAISKSIEKKLMKASKCIERFLR